MPIERMVLSSYQFRRDITVFQPSEEMLGQFENMGPQCEWTLEIPRSGNNIDYNAISDIKFVVYFDADTTRRAAHVKALYPTTGARSTVLSSRFQYPDEYFRLDAEGSVSRHAIVRVQPGSTEAHRLRRASAIAAARAWRAAAHDHTHVQQQRDGRDRRARRGTGAVGTMAPFAAWKDASPIDTWRVALGEGVSSAAIADMQLFYTYAFKYRADGSLI